MLAPPHNKYFGRRGMLMSAQLLLPVGQKVNPNPAQMPDDVSLTGRFGSVERLKAKRHAAGLWQTMAGHDHIWTYIPAGPFVDPAAFATYIEHCEHNPERLFHAVIDPSGQAVGFIALMEIRLAMRVIEVGNIVYAPLLQRTPLATEAQYLIARHIFETLGFRRYEWKCDALNARSRRAAERYGFAYEGLFRQHMIIKGRNRDTAWYSMLDREWPARKAAFERWLAADNFDANGRQKASLASSMT
jgi:RimJ/RimL family protein N-acetyltransferase